MIGSVVGYEGFKSYGDKAYPSHKPGVTAEPRNFFEGATTEKPNGTKCLENFSRFSTDYRQNVSSTVKIGDYKVPCKDANPMVQYDLAHKPELFAHTKRAAFENSKKGSTSNGFAAAAQQSLANSAAHWQSTYKAETESSAYQTGSKASPPLWSLPREAYICQRTFFNTEYHQSFGKLGTNPRDKLPHDATKMSNEAHELTLGTTKVTTHIPGYNGYIPKSDFNEKALQQSKLQGASRNTIVKQNIVENYSVKLPGYSGHMPMSTLNDRGVIRPNCLSTKGESFV